MSNPNKSAPGNFLMFFRYWVKYKIWEPMLIWILRDFGLMPLNQEQVDKTGNYEKGEKVYKKWYHGSVFCYAVVFIIMTVPAFTWLYNQPEPPPRQVREYTPSNKQIPHEKVELSVFTEKTKEIVKPYTAKIIYDKTNSVISLAVYNNVRNDTTYKLENQIVEVYQAVIDNDTSKKYFEDLQEQAKRPEISYEVINPKLKNEEKASNGTSTSTTILIILIVVSLTITITSLLKKKQKTQADTMGKSKAREFVPQESSVTFKDVAGIEEVIGVFRQIVRFLNEPERYEKLGAELRKGVLLKGPPGTGKTLLGEALAGEAGVPFFSISGSDFVEMFVGVGASRIRDLFKNAKAVDGPCIIFIDEIDAVGGKRGGGTNDERQQTLNQLLVEMNGFNNTHQIVLIAATNRPDMLDPALLRPGRFDRKVDVNLPDINGREKILKVHAKTRPLANDVRLKDIAAATRGFSGADLKNILNEAAIVAGDKDLEETTMKEINKAMDEIMMGLEKEGTVVRSQDRAITAYHEAGHALAARLQADGDVVRKVSITPRGNTGGVTWFFPKIAAYHTKEMLEASLATGAGGRVAEEIIFQKTTTGAMGDLRQVGTQARRMVKECGMCVDKLGFLAYMPDDNQQNMWGGGGQIFSEETNRIIDTETRKFADVAYKKSKSIITENIDILHALADELMEKETISGKELDELILKTNPDIKLVDKSDL